MTKAVKLAADMNVSKIPAPYDEIYKVIGYEGFVVLFAYLGGQSLYIPSMRNVLSEAIKTQAAKELECTSYTMEQVAKKYGYSCRYLRKILNGK